MAFNQDMKAIVPKPTIDADYLLYALGSRRAALTREIGTSAHGTRTLGSAALEALQIAIPRTSEQRAIGYVLSQIEERLGIATQTSTVLGNLRTAVIRTLFCAGLRGEPLKRAAIGMIPQSWEVIRLGDVIDRMNYGTSERCHSGGSGRPVLRIPNIVHDRVDTADLKYADLSESEIEKLRLKDGDLLFVRTNGDPAYIGRCAVYRGDPPDALFASYLIRARVDEARLLPDFVQSYLAELGREQLLAAANSASDGKYNIDTGGLRGLLIPMPDLHEQKEIVHRLQAIDQRVIPARRRVETLSALFAASARMLTQGQLRLAPQMIGELSLRAREKAPKPTGTVDERVVQAIVQRIVEAVAPERIVLFGSAARGEMRPDSDLDFLVVKATPNRLDTTQEIRRRLRGVAPGIPKDIVVVTPEDVERDRDTIGLIIRPALREGRVVYAA